MKERPKLIGIIKLDILWAPKGQTRGRDAQELIRNIAFDTEGNAWGLVQRATRTPGPSDPTPSTFRELRSALDAWRVSFVRWVPCSAIPFVAGDGPPELGEHVGPEGWINVPGIG